MFAYKANKYAPNLAVEVIFFKQMNMTKRMIPELSPDEVRFQSLLRRMENKTISRNQAIVIVGGEKRLDRLMQEGTIRSNKPAGSSNRQWRINAADCYRCVKPKGFATARRAVATA